MFPGDSEMFDERARSCGATVATILGIARLYLETEASVEVVPPIVADGRFRWLDLTRAHACDP
jgi:hypothetical protein